MIFYCKIYNQIFKSRLVMNRLNNVPHVWEDHLPHFIVTAPTLDRDQRAAAQKAATLAQQELAKESGSYS
jgi:hypothetical protein